MKIINNRTYTEAVPHSVQVEGCNNFPLDEWKDVCIFALSLFHELRVVDVSGIVRPASLSLRLHPTEKFNRCLWFAEFANASINPEIAVGPNYL